MRESESADIRRMLESHADTLRAVASKLCPNAADAKDLVQDTFERALRMADRFEPGNARAWLVMIMRNLFIDRCRASRRQPRHEPIDAAFEVPEPEPEQEPEWSGISTAELHAALVLLDAPFRRVYELYAFTSASYEEIARTLNIPRATVGTRLARARQKIREILLAELARSRARRLDHDCTL